MLQPGLRCLLDLSALFQTISTSSVLSSRISGLVQGSAGTGSTLHSPWISEREGSICASICASLLLWGHIAQHFQNSAQIAEQTPVLGLGELVTSSVLQGEVSNCRMTLGRQIILRAERTLGGL